MTFKIKLNSFSNGLSSLSWLGSCLIYECACPWIFSFFCCIPVILPSFTYWKEGESVSHLVMSDFLQPHGLWPTRLLCPWDSPGRNTWVGCHAILQGIFLTKGSNLYLLCLLHWQADALPLHHHSSEGQLLVSRQTTETAGPTCWKPRCSLFRCRFVGLLSCHYKQRPGRSRGQTHGIILWSGQNAPSSEKLAESLKTSSALPRNFASVSRYSDFSGW